MLAQDPLAKDSGLHLDGCYALASLLGGTMQRDPAAGALISCRRPAGSAQPDSQRAARAQRLLDPSELPDKCQGCHQVVLLGLHLES